MDNAPLPALMFGYGLAALIGLAAWIGASVPGGAALLGVWFGGAALTLVAAAATRVRRAPPAAVISDDDADLAAELRRFESDRIADVAEREARRHA